MSIILDDIIKESLDDLTMMNESGEIDGDGDLIDLVDNNELLLMPEISKEVEDAAEDL